MVLERIPGPGSAANDTLAYHRIAELQALGVRVETATLQAVATSSLAVSRSDGKPAVVWKWPGDVPLGPELDGAQRSRLGREQNAAEEVAFSIETAPAQLPALREFHQFTLEPGVRHNIFARAYLGHVLKHEIVRLLIIDPHILYGDQQLRILEQFLRSLRVAKDSQVRVRAARVRGDLRRGDFANWSEQNAAVTQLKQRLKDVDVAIEFPADGQFVDHDRVLQFHIRTGTDHKFFKVILGQGLFGFDAACRRRSHGVCFEVADREFEGAWQL